MAKKKPDTRLVWVKGKSGGFSLRRVSAKKKRKVDVRLEGLSGRVVVGRRKGKVVCDARGCRKE